MSSWVKQWPAAALLPLLLCVAGCNVEDGGTDGESNFVECQREDGCEHEAAGGAAARSDAPRGGSRASNSGSDSPNGGSGAPNGASGGAAGNGELAAPSGGTAGTPSDSPDAPAVASSASSAANPTSPAGQDTDAGSGAVAPMNADDGPPQPCLLGQEVCAAGYKCTESWGADDFGLPWTGHWCGPVEGSKATGEVCEHFDRSSETPGIVGYRADDCDADNYCLRPGALAPTCRPYCRQDEALESPAYCPNGDRCTTYWTTNFGLCVPECDPTRADACPMGLACNTFDRNDGVFVCGAASETRAHGERCGAGHQCGPGLACEKGAPACAADDALCCTVFCDRNDGSTCAEVPGTTCKTPELLGSVPDHVGVCTL